MKRQNQDQLGSTNNRQHRLLAAAAAGASICLSTTAFAQDPALIQRLEALEARFQELESENQRLREQLDQLQPEEQSLMTAAVQEVESPPEPRLGDTARIVRPLADRDLGRLVGTNSTYGYRMLDHAEDVNSKPLVQLTALQDQQLTERVTLSGQITAIANYQWSDTPDKFGYLMRHPTANNQLGNEVSEAVIHSATLAVTARVDPAITGYVELLYDPEQSFGQGSITALARNQIQLRRGWVMFGDMDRIPLYGLIGKMDIPFGLNDTVNPFTNSTNWHAFSGLAYGVQVGLFTDGLHLRGMAVQGGSQFRGANNPVQGSSTPSRVNNFAFDANYTLDFANDAGGITAGFSYLHGTAYCQGYPVVHFNPCEDNNPGIATYGRLTYDGLTLLGEYAQTTRVWPGTAVPDLNNPLSEFAAVRASSLTVGGRYGFGHADPDYLEEEFALSLEYSRFVSGDDGSPWKRQNQVVFGGSWYIVPSANLFAEFVHIDGYVPLNFLSGGNLPDGSTHSVNEANTNAVIIGGQFAF